MILRIIALILIIHLPEITEKKKLQLDPRFCFLSIPMKNGNILILVKQYWAKQKHA